MRHDIIVIGAGPAGMGAAATASQFGANVLLLDDQPTPGGQIYKAIEARNENAEKLLGADYMDGLKLVKELRNKSVKYIKEATVWQVTNAREVAYSVRGKAKIVRAPWVVIATGAIERPFPIPGWTLPGVMTAGAAQTLLKTSGIVADGSVFAGCGPLLYLVVSQYLKAGVEVAALLDTRTQPNLAKTFSSLPAAISRWDMLIKGLRWEAEIRRRGTKIIKNVIALNINGDNAVEGVTYTTKTGHSAQITTGNVFLHHGVVPNINLTMAADIDHIWDEGQLCWHPKVNEWGQTNIDGIVVVGDGASVGGAVGSQMAGRLSALECLVELGKIAPEEHNKVAQPYRAALNRERKIRPLLDSWFRPAINFRVPDGDTMVCRCEELTANDILEVMDIGLAGPNQLKSYCRAGMGPCQGRLCGLTVQEMISQKSGRSMSEVGYYRLRPPIKPISLSELADMETEPPINEG